MRFGSVCSGIEAASVAWEPLGWEAAWLSEIEAFPSAVLAHHWPDVPNLGDMTLLPERVAAGEVEAPDVLVGGTPCQAFSVAGRRESLADARGNLTLTYVELADAIDDKRNERGEQPAIIVWENVPGVLNTKDNAFGCFLAGLAGEDVPLQPPGKRWTNAGLVLGPKRAVAWRILDAQYFGLAQRRRRVFVVASARDGFDPSQVLLEFDSLRRDSPPSREARQETTGDAGSGTTGTSHWDAVTNPHPTLNQSHNTGGIGASNQEVFLQRGSGLVPTCYYEAASQRAFGTASVGYANAGHFGTMKEVDVGDPLRAKGGDTGYGGESLVCESGNVAIPILEPGARTGKSTTDVRAGLGVGDDGDPMFTLQAGKQHGVAALAFQERGRADGRALETNGDLAYALTAPSGGGRAQERNVCVSVTGDIAHTLNTANNGKGCSEDRTGRGVPTIATSVAVFDPNQITSRTNRSVPKPDLCHTLPATANSPVAFSVHTVALRGREGGATAEVGGEVATALRASSGGGDKPHVLASVPAIGLQTAVTPKFNHDLQFTLTTPSPSGGGQPAACMDTQLAVRRLTPVETERLQGFPDGHTDVPYRNKPAADGPRYKAVGNSMAVPVMAWIGRRIIHYLASV